MSVVTLATYRRPSRHILLRRVGESGVDERRRARADAAGDLAAAGADAPCAAARRCITAADHHEAV